MHTPEGSFPCDIDYEGKYDFIGSLNNPDKTKGAPVYILQNDKVVSTILPKEELGLEKFMHIHNATMRTIDGKIYLIVQAWNPGDFAILEQVKNLGLLTQRRKASEAPLLSRSRKSLCEKAT